MTDIKKEEIRELVMDVLKGFKPTQTRDPKPVSHPLAKGPYILSVFHAGVRKLDEALNQIQLIEAKAGKCGIYTGESARAWVCGRDVTEKAGAQCILDKVNTEGLNQVLQRADVLVLPTFCFKVAAKVAHLTCDCQESNIVLTALLQGKKVLATRDSFLICDILINPALKKEIDTILEKLESFGMVLCETGQLNAVLQELIASANQSDSAQPRAPSTEKTISSLALITAKDIHAAVDQKKTVITLAPGGVVTPLARDLAKEYSIRIVES